MLIWEELPFDMSLIINGKPSVTNETEQEFIPLLIPLVDIHTIGAGGGSVAWLENEALRVGPEVQVQILDQHAMVKVD